MFKQIGFLLLLLILILGVAYYGVSLISTWSGEFYLNNPLFHVLFAFTLVVITLLVIIFIRNLALFFLPHFKTKLRMKIFTAFVLLILGPALFSILMASGVINQGLDRLLRIQVKRIVEVSSDTTNKFLKFVESELERKVRELSLKKRVYPYTLKVYGVDGFFREVGRKTEKVGNFPLSKEEVKELEKLNRYAFLDKESGQVVVCVKRKWSFSCVSKKLPESLVKNVEQIEDLQQNYRNLVTYKTPIKAVYTFTFGIMGLAVLFGALWFARYFEKRISIPVEALYKATQKISQGDLSIRIPEEEATDELKHVIQAFNSMVEQLQKLQKRLEENRRYLEELLNSISPAIITFDYEGRVISCNRKAKELLGLSDKEKGISLWEALKPYENLLRAVKDLIEKGKHKAGVREEIKGREKFLTVELLSSPTIADRILIIEDMTDLVRAKKAEAWKEVAQRIAHEIKNPLTPIVLNAERIKRLLEKNHPQSREKIEKAVNSILEEVEVIKRLINEFRKFTRLPLPEKRLTDLNQLIKNALEPYENQVKLTFEFEDLPKLPLDRSLFREVLLNLVKNSVEAGAKEVKVSTTMKRDKVFVVFRDDGPGIPEELMEKLFAPYVSGKEEGWGLGLSIVKKIIEDHGGKIYTVDRNTFVIELPL